MTNPNNIPDDWTIDETGRAFPTPPLPDRHAVVRTGCVETLQDGTFHHFPVRVIRKAIARYDAGRQRAHRFLCPPIRASVPVDERIAVLEKALADEQMLHKESRKELHHALRINHSLRTGSYPT